MLATCNCLLNPVQCAAAEGTSVGYCEQCEQCVLTDWWQCVLTTVHSLTCCLLCALICVCADMCALTTVCADACVHCLCAEQGRRWALHSHAGQAGARHWISVAGDVSSFCEFPVVVCCWLVRCCRCTAPAKENLDALLHLSSVFCVCVGVSARHVHVGFGGAHRCTARQQRTPPRARHTTADTVLEHVAA